MIYFLRFINISKYFCSKRVAIVGAASSVFDDPMGDFIDGCDFVIRMNKAPYIMGQEKAAYLGSKTDMLFHSFYENEYSGGGKLNFKLYDEMGIRYVINPKFTFDAVRSVFNFYKKYLLAQKTYLPKRKAYSTLRELCKPYLPTMGLCALYFVLTSRCQECYITGFTFFRTSYIDGYRDAYKSSQESKLHIQSAGLHNAELEFEIFMKLYDDNKANKKIKLDRQLAFIIESGKDRIH